MIMQDNLCKLSYLSVDIYTLFFNKNLRHKHVQAEMNQNFKSVLRIYQSSVSVEKDFILPLFFVRSINKGKTNIRFWSIRTTNSNNKGLFLD